jgi:hypothetical protein
LYKKEGLIRHESYLMSYNGISVPELLLLHLIVIIRDYA